jgi:hypothetical protein
VQYARLLFHPLKDDDPPMNIVFRFIQAACAGKWRGFLQEFLRLEKGVSVAFWFPAIRPHLGISCHSSNVGGDIDG